jgi:hypothetical protein
MSDSDTNPGGKTQEQIDEEAAPDPLEVAALKKQAEELRADLDNCTASNEAMARREVSLSVRLSRALVELDVVLPSLRHLWALRTVLVLSWVALFVMGWGLSRRPAPIVCPPAPECPVAVVEEAPPAMPSASLGDGFYASGLDGEAILRPWPVVEGYAQETFIADCHMVCEVSSHYGDPPGRVLLMDPAHLVCICFRGGSWPVERWVGWERIHR